MNATKNGATDFKIYIADLSAYVAGQLRGKWVTPAEYADEEELAQAITEVLGSADKEWAIHDYQGVKLAEHEALQHIMAIARACEDWGCEKVQAAIDHGVAVDLETISEAIADCDGGEHRSREDWAHEQIESAYDLDKMLGTLAAYFDYEAFARDAELGGDVSFVRLSNGNVWVVNHH